MEALQGAKKIVTGLETFMTGAENLQKIKQEQSGGQELMSRLGGAVGGLTGLFPGATHAQGRGGGYYGLQTLGESFALPAQQFLGLQARRAPQMQTGPQGGMVSYDPRRGTTRQVMPPPPRYITAGDRILEATPTGLQEVYKQPQSEEDKLRLEAQELGVEEAQMVLEERKQRAEDIAELRKNMTPEELERFIQGQPPLTPEEKAKRGVIADMSGDELKQLFGGIPIVRPGSAEDFASRLTEEQKNKAARKAFGVDAKGEGNYEYSTVTFAEWKNVGEVNAIGSPQMTKVETPYTKIVDLDQPPFNEDGSINYNRERYEPVEDYIRASGEIGGGSDRSGLPWFEQKALEMGDVDAALRGGVSPSMAAPQPAVAPSMAAPGPQPQLAVGPPAVAPQPRGAPMPPEQKKAAMGPFEQPTSLYVAKYYTNGQLDLRKLAVSRALQRYEEDGNPMGVREGRSFPADIPLLEQYVEQALAEVERAQGLKEAAARQKPLPRGDTTATIPALTLRKGHFGREAEVPMTGKDELMLWSGLFSNPVEVLTEQARRALNKIPRVGKLMVNVYRLGRKALRGEVMTRDDVNRIGSLTKAIVTPEPGRESLVLKAYIWALRGQGLTPDEVIALGFPEDVVRNTYASTGPLRSLATPLVEAPATVRTAMEALKNVKQLMAEPQE